MLKYLLLPVLFLTTLAHAQVRSLPGHPYLAPQITRTYTLGDLESCPGLLNMHAGDLWTLTFPEPIKTYYLTRIGLVDIKTEDHRLIIAALEATGNVPLLVLTENDRAPKFILTLETGPGGSVKDIQILPGAAPTLPCTASAALHGRPSN